MKKTTCIWIIITLITLNIATISTVVYQKKKCTETQFSNVEKIKVPNSNLGRFFREELNLNPEQHAKFREYRQEFHAAANSLANTMQERRNKMLLELRKQNPDKKLLHSLAKELGDLHEELKHLTFEYYLSMKSICSQEQQERLFAIFYNMSSGGGEIQMPNKQQLSKSKK